MTSPATQLRLRRQDLVFRDPYEKLLDLFNAWPKYDDYVAEGHSPPDQIVRADIEVINAYASMGARSKYEVWQDVIDAGPLPDLRAIDPGLDLFLASEASWAQADAHSNLETLFKSVRAKGIGIAVSTKVLHIKRPRLIPVCDSLVLRLFDLPPGEIASGVALIASLRGQRHQWLPLLQDLQKRLRSAGTERSLVRIADALLWSMGRDLGDRAKRGALTPPEIIQT